MFVCVCVTRRYDRFWILEKHPTRNIIVAGNMCYTITTLQLFPNAPFHFKYSSVPKDVRIVHTNYAIFHLRVTLLFQKVFPKFTIYFIILCLFVMCVCLMTTTGHDYGIQILGIESSEDGSVRAKFIGEIDTVQHKVQTGRVPVSTNGARLYFLTELVFCETLPAYLLSTFF